MPVLYLELDKETKDIKMQALHGLRHCHVNGGERVGRDLQAQRDWWESSQGQGSSGGWTNNFRNNDWKEAMPRGLAQHQGCEEKGRAISNIKCLSFVLKGYAIHGGSLQC